MLGGRSNFRIQLNPSRRAWYKGYMTKMNGQRAAAPQRPRVRTLQDLRDAAARYRGELPDEASDFPRDDNDEQATDDQHDL